MTTRNSIRILDNNTLAEIAIAYDLTNTKIHQQINDKYTLDFNILPYENVWRIGYPNLLEIDDDYFQVRRVTKNRGASLDMSVSCEHISYEMNGYYLEGIENTYTGTPTEILGYLLDGLRFTVGTVAFTAATEFKTSTVGMRSRIIEFANQIGAEVKFYMFEVSLLLRRGGDRGLTIEVGENLLSMTEITETQVDGEIVKSYEVGVIDLNKIMGSDGQPLKDVEIHLGDTVNLIDVQFGIDINLHIVSTEYDPFSKALPTVEIGNTIKNLYSTKEQVKKEPIDTGGVIYGVKIDTTNSNPETALTYTDDATGFTPAIGNNEVFDYGSWEDKFPFNAIRPCLFKAGAVNYYLNTNDYTKKEDGSTADITSGADGDVMVEFPKIWWKFERIGTDLYIRYASYAVDGDYKCLAHTRGTAEKDKIYISTYLGWSDTSNKLRSLSGKTPTTEQTISTFRAKAQANGAGYEQIAYYQILMLQVLFIVIFKSCDSQTALGRGFVDGNSAKTITGGTNIKGMNFGETTGKQQMKFLGIEDFWGNCFHWVDGLLSDAANNILIGDTNFNDIGNGYTNYGQASTVDSSGYIEDIQGGTNTGFIVKNGSGSTTTYYCDCGYVSASSLPFFGGRWGFGPIAGAFHLRLNIPPSGLDHSCSARLCFL